MLRFQKVIHYNNNVSLILSVEKHFGFFIYTSEGKLISSIIDAAC